LHGTASLLATTIPCGPTKKKERKKEREAPEKRKVGYLKGYSYTGNLLVSLP